MATQFEVLVVGAGPVGLFLTRELQRHGVSVGLVEMGAHPSEHSKALALMPRTLEVFEMAGILAPFEAVANRVIRAAIIIGEKTLVSVPVDPEGTRAAYIGMVPQDVTERILLEQLRAVGGEVRYGTEATQASESGDGVKVTLRSGAGLEEEVTTRFLVGCDGAHSTVRKLAGIAFEGSEYPEDFILADLETETDVPADEMQLCPHPDGAFAIFPMSATRRRLVAMAPNAPEEVTLPLVNRLLKARGMGRLQGSALLWGSRFRIHHREARQMQKGAIFLAGDAAHIHSPFGGQGMNTGLQDAWNLAWKLRLVLEGSADPALLASYSEERHPVVHSVVRLTHAMTRVMTAKSRLVRAMRNAAVVTAMRARPVRAAAVARLTQLGVGYPGGPRVPDEALGGGRGERLFGVLGERWVAVLPEGTDARGLSKYGSAVRVVEGVGPRARLIRPDGYLGMDAGMGAGALARLERGLETRVLLPADPPGALRLTHPGPAS